MNDDQLYLSHIKQAIERILSYSAQGRENFLVNTLVQDAVVRNFEIIGEAAKHLGDSTKARCPDVPWRRVAGFRDILIHNYMGVDAKEVWNVIVVNLPILRQAVDRLLAEK
jgi:uncharacterized protein with HEPN domain